MGAFKRPQYTYLKDGSYYFSRAVPLDLRYLYSKPRIIQALRTKSQAHAKTASRFLASKLDDYWLGIRLKHIDVPVPAAHLLIDHVGPSALSELSTIEDAKDLYISVKGEGKDRGSRAIMK